MAPGSGRPDVVVIGAGFGGLGAALRLAELGAKVVVLETLSYPGGCAGTFRRSGFSFEAGATLSSGLGPGQLFRRWIDRYGLEVETETLDPVVELRTPSDRFSVPADRDALRGCFLGRRDAPVPELSRFFDLQRRVADIVWNLFERTDLRPPFGLRQGFEHLERALDYLRIAPLMGRSLGAVLRGHRLEGYEPLRIYLDALCQITVQCPAAEAEALFALGAMDYYFRGARHVRGGVGSLARALVRAIEGLGGEVRLGSAATRLSRAGGEWRIETRRGEIAAPVVVANLLPQSLRRLAGFPVGELPSLDRLARRVEEGWGAAMIYRVARARAGASARAFHLALVRDPGAPFIEGNHVFCSFGSANDGAGVSEGYRTVTVSTHVRPSRFSGATEEERARYVSSVQARMRATLGSLVPEWEEDVRLEMTASPRTFERFTGRYLGLVGGVPRRAGLHNYAGIGPRTIRPGLHLVGDTVFPGQSMLAAALGGVKLADSLAA